MCSKKCVCSAKYKHNMNKCLRVDLMILCMAPKHVAKKYIERNYYLLFIFSNYGIFSITPSLYSVKHMFLYFSKYNTYIDKNYILKKKKVKAYSPNLFSREISFCAALNYASDYTQTCSIW